MGVAAQAAGLVPGTRLGRYTLVRRLAVGGMAELYVAQQRGAAGFAKIVALKRILPHLAEDPTFTRMFHDEARLASDLDHPNLAHVLDFGEDNGEHFLTMEYVHGRNLLQLLRSAEHETLPLATSLAIVARVARGLHDLHEQCDPAGRPMGLVHRDVSPSNVLVSFDGKVKLTDFGIAKAMELTMATRSGTFKGKLGHSSPEQARGEEIDRRSDVFCLGILLYEATTGARAFSGANEFAVLGRVARGDYVPPADVVEGYPKALTEIIDNALRLEPQQRYATALEVAKAVEDFARASEIRLTTEAIADTMRSIYGPAPPVVVPEELRLAAEGPAATVAVAVPPRRGSPAVWIAVPLAVVVGAAGAWTLARHDATPPPPQTVPDRVPVIAEPDPAPEPARVQTPEAVTAPQPPPTPPAEIASAPTAAPAPEEAPASARRGGKKSKRKRKKKKPPEPKVKGLYPPGR